MAAIFYVKKLTCLSILAGCTENDLKAQIDFWTSDKGSELDILLDHLDVYQEKKLKCCAHIILGINHVIESVLIDKEQAIGVQILIKLTAGDKALNSPSTSIHTLGVFALYENFCPPVMPLTLSLFTMTTSCGLINISTKSKTLL